jgi:hypothetical protein
MVKSLIFPVFDRLTGLFGSFNILERYLHFMATIDSKVVACFDGMEPEFFSAIFKHLTTTLN